MTRLPAELAVLVTELHAATLAVAGDALVAMYVVGSTAQGRRTGASDVDVLTVLDTAARIDTEDLARRIVATAEAGAHRLEYVAYDRDAVAAPGYPLRYVLNVNAGGGGAIHVSTVGDPPHWFLLDVSMARQHAIPLAGPPADELLGEPDRRDVARAILDALDWHRDHGEPVHTVLNAARAWHYLDNGAWLSKPDAGAWAASRWHGSLIRDALDAHADGHAGRALDEVEVAALLDHIAALARNQE